MAGLKMNYCMQCGAKLTTRHLDLEGEVPYCETCGEFRFPVFSTAVSMIVTTRERDKILLIKQYGRDSYILVAGYVNKGEDAEDAVVREVREEMGLKVTEVHFNHSRYFEPSNVLMLNFTAIVEDTRVHENREIDSYRWFTLQEARENVRWPSLAGDFLDGYLTGDYHFTK